MLKHILNQKCDVLNFSLPGSKNDKWYRKITDFLLNVFLKSSFQKSIVQSVVCKTEVIHKIWTFLRSFRHANGGFFVFTLSWIFSSFYNLNGYFIPKAAMIINKESVQNNWKLCKRKYCCLSLREVGYDIDLLLHQFVN